MKRKSALMLVLIFSLSLFSACSEGEKAQDGEKVIINFPTASASGALYAVGAAICAVIGTLPVSLK